MDTKPPLPPFTPESARPKVRMAEDSMELTPRGARAQDGQR